MNIDLRTTTIFQALSDSALAEVTAALKPRQLAQGEILFKKGDPGQDLIIVQEGKVAIYNPAPEDPAAGQAIRVFQPGDLLGEMALIDKKPRSLSARAEEASRIYALSGADFQHLLSTNPDLVSAVMAGLSDRIRYTTEFLTEVRQWVGRMSEGAYQGAVAEDANARYADKTLATLAGEFAQMASKVKQREDTLRQQVHELQIQIDESKRKQERENIMGTEYYKSLQERAKQMRQQRQDNES
jgi:CRP-like cAMP-binding protein